LEVQLREASDNLKRMQDGTKPSEQVESENQRLTEATATLTAELCHLRDGRGSLEVQLIESQRQIQEGVSRLPEPQRILRKSAGNAAGQSIESSRSPSNCRSCMDKSSSPRCRVGQQDSDDDLEQHLRQNEDHLSRLSDDLQKERTDRQLVEQQLKSADALRAN
jgi:hypothetical protein